MTTPNAPSASELPAERADLLETLRQARGFLRYTVNGLTDEQAKEHTTVSELCLGGLIKHVSGVEERWANFIEMGPSAMYNPAEDVPEGWQDRFRMLEGETLAGLLASYEKVAQRTDEMIASLPDLNVSQPLPEAPWFKKGARWTARRVLIHMIAETSQHAGHADILRESLDGQKTMG